MRANLLRVLGSKYWWKSLKIVSKMVRLFKNRLYMLFMLWFTDVLALYVSAKQPKLDLYLSRVCCDNEV